MDALLFCGGRGSRLDADVEKPLLAVGGEPMVDRVLAALSESRVDTVRAVVSPHAPRTREHVRVPTIETPGEGYVADLSVALEAVEPPVLTAPADLPLLAPSVVDRVLDAAAESDADSLTVVVPTALKRALGVSVDEHEAEGLVPAGLNVVGNGPDARWRSWDARLAVNVNRRPDAAVAERLLTSGEENSRSDAEAG